MEEEKKHTVSIPIEQAVFRKIAYFCVESKGNDLYFLNEAVNLLIAEMGFEILRKEFKDKSDIVEDMLVQFNSLVNQVKLYFDKIKTGRAKEDEKKEALNALKKIPVIQTVIYRIFVLYIQKSNLQYKSIPSQAFQTAKFGVTSPKKDKKDEEKK